jgi:glycine oxidase ThiO
VTDVLVIGGGIIGLAIALQLRLEGAQVTVLSRDFKQAASHAAAGMLAPQAEAIPASPMLELCLRSRDLYPAWAEELEAMTGASTGYWACGILKPVYQDRASGERDDESRLPQSSDAIPSYWLEQAAIHDHQPGLSAKVVGGWWYPKDAQVDNRSLTATLWMAAREAGVAIQEGITAESVLTEGDRVVGVRSQVDNWHADHYILATGAWSNELLPVPVHPKKGQMLSVKVPVEQGLPLQHVLFGEEIYIVPRRDGRIIVGATSEAVGFTPNNTPAGVQALLTRAIRLFPAIADYPIQECWWGFRPATPDEAPILGTSPYTNLTLATGHYRNGILLTPVTALLIANLVVRQKIDPLLTHFHYSRFLSTP